jgi:hypothetical protein
MDGSTNTTYIPTNGKINQWRHVSDLTTSQRQRPGQGTMPITRDDQSLLTAAHNEAQFMNQEEESNYVALAPVSS